MLKAVIFDFDGTIADTLPVYVDIFNRLAKKLHLKEISQENISLLKNKPMKEVFQYFHIPFFLVPIVVWQLQRSAKKEIHKGTLYSGMLEVISHLDKNYQLFLLTSNTKENVERFFEKYSIHPFSKIYSNKNPFSKVRIIQRLLSENAFDNNEVVYVGDEARDVESCKEAGIKIISVDWGFSTSSLLETYEPEYIVSKPEEIIAKVEEIDKTSP